MIKLCIANRKGGVGKTTTAVNLSSILAELGKRVLLIDFDPQGDASDNFGFDIDGLDITIYDVITNKVSIEDAIQKTEFGVDVIPSNSQLAEAELQLASKINREKILSEVVDESKLDYDFLILDLPPNLGLLTINGLVASDQVIVSVDVGRFSLSAIGDLLEIVNLVKKSQLNPELDILGILMTKVDYRTTMLKETEISLNNIAGDKVFESKIRQSAAISKSQSEQKPINYHDKDCVGYKEYLSLSEEVLKNVK